MQRRRVRCGWMRQLTRSHTALCWRSLNSSHPEARNPQVRCALAWTPCAVVVPAGKRGAATTAAAGGTARAPRRMTFMQEQTALEEENRRKAEQAAAAAAADAAQSAAPPAPPAEPLLLSQLLLRAPAQSSTQPVPTMSPMQTLAHAGLIGRVGSRFVVLPGGMRVLSKIERLLADEMGALRAQAVQALPTSAQNDAASASASRPRAGCDAPYPSSFADELPLLTQLLVGEFNVDGRDPYRVALSSATLSAEVSHPPESAAVHPTRALWSGAKHTRDYMSMHTSRASATAAYHQMLDGFSRALSHLGCQPLLLETSPHEHGAHGVDADMAHEVHVLADTNRAAKAATPASVLGSVLKCDKCDYAAKLERAVSRVELPSQPESAAATPAVPAAAAPSASAPSSIVSPQHLAPPLHRYFREWVLSQLALSFPPHVVEQLSLGIDSAHWKCELVVERFVLDVHASAEEAGQQDPIAYLVLLRAEDELNLHALAEHIAGRQQLLRVETASLTVDILRRILPDPSDVLTQLHAAAATPATPAASPSATPVGSKQSLLFASDSLRFDPRPELLVDLALIPRGLDLDMEAIQQHQMEEAEAEFLSAEAEAMGLEQQGLEAAAATEAEAVALEARMESGLLNSAKKLKPGEAIDFVQVEMAAKGLDVRRAQAELVQEAARLQQNQHEEEEMERARAAELEALQARVDADENAPAYDPSLDADVAGAAASPATAPAAAASSSFTISSALIPHFEYSKQGSFRLAQPGEECAMTACEGGILRSVRTRILANAAFIGKQELVDEKAAAHTPSISSRKKAAKKKTYLHTAYARFSPLDTLAHLALTHLHAPSAFAKPIGGPSTPSSPNAVTLDTLTSLTMPALVAPYQLAILPVMSDASPPALGSMRDFHRQRAATSANAARNAAADEASWSTARSLYSEVMSLSSSPPSAEQVALGVDSFPPLSGDVLLDDRTALPVNARVQHLVSLGVPLLILVQPRALAAGQVSLVLNRPGISMQPRRVAIEGLAPLLHKMLRSNYAPVLQSRYKLREQQRQQLKLDEERRAAEEEAEAQKAEFAAQFDPSQLE